MSETRTKTCATCKEELSVDDFYFSRRVNKPMSHCKECSKKKTRVWEKNNLAVRSAQKVAAHRKHPERARKQYLQHTHGLTLEEYDGMVRNQKGLCAICDKPQNTRHSKNLYVDHEHATGKVRALLCSRCNMGIGQLQDDPDLVEAAARYLRTHRDS